jgi:hypothetical protein
MAAVQTDMARIRQTVTQLLRKRSQLINERAQATAQVDQQLESLEEWEKRVTETIRRSPAPAPSRKAQALPSIPPQTLLATCFPLDFSLEEARLLASLRASLASSSSGETQPVASSTLRRSSGSNSAEQNVAGSPPALSFPPLASDNPADRQLYLGSVRQMLEVGLQEGEDKFMAAQRHYETAKQLSQKDPRLFDAWSLVCLRHGRPLEAERQAERAVQLMDQYLPPWQTLARAQLLQRRFPSALQTLTRLARVLELTDKRALCQSEKENSATWVGRAVAVAEQHGESSTAVKQSVAREKARLLATWSSSLRAAYEQGRQEANAWYQATADEREQLRRTQQDQQLSREQGKLAGVAERQEQVQDEKIRNQQKAKELKESLDAQTKQFQDRYNQLETSYAQLQVQEEILRSQIGEAERAGHDYQVTKGRTGQLVPLGVMSNLQKRHDAVQLQMTEVARQAQLVRQSYEAFLAEHHLEGRKLTENELALDKRKQQVDRAERQRRATSASGSPSERGVELAAALSGLLPLDHDSEANRILGSFSEAGVPAP